MHGQPLSDDERLRRMNRARLKFGLSEATGVSLGDGPVLSTAESNTAVVRGVGNRLPRDTSLPSRRVGAAWQGLGDQATWAVAGLAITWLAALYFMPSFLFRPAAPAEQLAAINQKLGTLSASQEKGKAALDTIDANVRLSQSVLASQIAKVSKQGERVVYVMPDYGMGGMMASSNTGYPGIGYPRIHADHPFMSPWIKVAETERVLKSLPEEKVKAFLAALEGLSESAKTAEEKQSIRSGVASLLLQHDPVKYLAELRQESVNDDTSQENRGSGLDTAPRPKSAPQLELERRELEQIDRELRARP